MLLCVNTIIRKFPLAQPVEVFSIKPMFTLSTNGDIV